MNRHVRTRRALTVVSRALMFKSIVGLSLTALALFGVTVPLLGIEPTLAKEGAAAGIGALLGALLALRAQLLAYPTDDPGLYRWVLVVMVAYLAVAFSIRWWLEKLDVEDLGHVWLTQLFNAATMASSVMVLWGVLDEEVLRLIGSTKPFLLIAGLAGSVYSLCALRPPRTSLPAPGETKAGL